MASLTISHGDLTPFSPEISEERAEAMIEDVLARAKRFAPCLKGSDLDPDVAAAAKAILRDVILRWYDQGSGVVVQKQTSVGPYQASESTDSSRSKPRFWPSEIRELQTLCTDGGPRQRKAFSLDLSGMASKVLIVIDGEVVDLATRPDLWLEYGSPW